MITYYTAHHQTAYFVYHAPSLYQLILTKKASRIDAVCKCWLPKLVIEREEETLEEEVESQIESPEKRSDVEASFGTDP